MKTSLVSEDKVIITAAITGGIHGKWANAALPVTPEQQAQDALDCYNAGAAVLHLHVRGSDGQNTPDLSVYNEAVRLIGEKCPIIRQIGNGIGARLSEKGAIINATLEERLNLLNIDPKPEMHTINAGTFEFRTKYGGAVFNNPLSFNEAYITGCNERGFGIEIEVYDVGHIANIIELVEKGLLAPPLHFSIVMGIMGGAPATPDNLFHMVGELPDRSTWQVVTIGRYHVRSTLIAMSMGGNVRTGLEDTLHYKKGEPAESNAQLVERMVRIAREIGREPATVDEAKEILGLLAHTKK
jgi:3-keto-5-aminohexanoate cleavage enzyme